MKIQFHGATIDLTAGEMAGFTLTIDGHTMVLGAPMTDTTVTHYYRIEFDRNFNWANTGCGKIPPIKVVRENARHGTSSIGLGEAKAVVEGTRPLYVCGPVWETSVFQRNLIDTMSTYTYSKAVKVTKVSKSEAYDIAEYK